MKKSLSFFAAIVLLGIFAPKVWAYDFSAVSPSGHTLYYNILTDGTGVGVTYPNSSAPGYWTGFTQPTGNLVIPSTVTYNGITYTVKSIGLCAFEGCSDMTSVSIPDSIINIGEEAFMYCNSLTSVTIPKNVSFIGYGAFVACQNLDTVFFNADNSNAVQSLISSDLIYTPFYANQYNYNIYSSPISHFIFGDNIDSIPYGICYNLDRLTSVTIPDSVTYIGNMAFGNCSGLTSVTIPDSVTYIGNYAFYNCSGLTEIHSLNPIAPTTQTNTFSGIRIGIPVYIPCGSWHSYTYSNWNYFPNFVQEEGFTFTATSANEQQGIVQIFTMPTCTNPQAVVYASANSGYHFDHWSDNSTANPYSLTVTDDLDLVAYFAADGGGTEGIDDMGVMGYRLWIMDGRITIEGAEGETVTVYDMTGRSVRNDNLPTGIYMVKVGAHPARKVVVIR